MENAVYRTIQEALNNVGKHARAENVRLRVSQKGGGIEVFVRDDGVGFEPGRASEGFGLVGMRERVEIAGGRVVISSGPGDGTTVWTVIPGEPEGREAPDATAESG